MMYLDDADTKTLGGKSLQITRRRIQLEGVQVFNEFYFHPDLLKFVNESVEVRYDSLNSSRVEVVLPDFRVIEAEIFSVVKNDDQFIDDSFELIQTKAELLTANAINQSLVSACHQALEISRIFVDLANPLTTATEKTKLQIRYTEIESNIREAIRNGGGN